MARLLTCEEVEHRVRLSRSSLYRKIRKGTFPASIQIGERAVRWREDEIVAWIESRPRSTEDAA